MKFLYAAPRFHPNQYPIIEGLIEKGHEVSFCVARVGEHEKHTGVKMIHLQMSECLRRYYAYRKISGVALEDRLINRFIAGRGQVSAVIRQEKPDVVIVRNRNLMSLQFNLQCKLKRIPIILYNQGQVMHPAGRQKSAKDFIKKLWRSLFPVNRISPCMYERYPRAGQDYRRDAHAYFLPFITRKDADAKEEYSTDNRRLRIMDIGKMRPYKNHGVLVKAAGILRDRGYDFSATIVGQCSSEEERCCRKELTELIAQLRLQEYIEVRDSIPYDQLMSVLRSYDIYVLTSKQEVANISVLDAMTCGLAVVATDYNGTSHYIDDGVNGSIFRTDDPESLAEKLAYYLDNRDKLREHGEKAAQKMRREYNFGKYYEKLEEVIEAAFREKGKSYRN